MGTVWFNIAKVILKIGNWCWRRYIKSVRTKQAAARSR